MNQVSYLVLNMAFYAIGVMMLEINIFSIIMGLSLIGLIPLAIWANIKDYAQIKDIMQK